MDKQSNDTGEFNFVQEKIISKRKKKVKRMLGAAAFVLAMAVLFGFVARYVFIQSDGLWRDILGLGPEEDPEEPKRQPVSFPSEEITTDSAQVSVTPGITGPVSPVPSPSVKPTASPIPTPTIVPTKPPVKEEKPDPSKAAEEASLEDYVSVMSDIRKLTNKVNTSLLKVTTITDGVNWMNEDIEMTENLTGVILGQNNVELLILTSYDKVKDVDRINVTFASSAILKASIFDYDSDYNLAVLAIRLKDIPKQYLETITEAELGDSGVVYTGMPVIAMGSPNGHYGSIGYGIVTSKGSSVYVTDNKLDLFNTDVADNENSDGIIINMKGQVIGLITRTLKEGLNTDLSTAIGITRLKPIILKLLNAAPRIYFGIIGEDIPANILKDRGLENGIYVTEVYPDSPAAVAGIRKGDIITALDGQNVTSTGFFAATLSEHKVGDVLDVTIYRSKVETDEMILPVELAKKTR